MEILFWTSLGLILYSYLIYPVCLAAIVYARRLMQQPDMKQEFQEWPTVSLIIAAYKEEDVILQRVNNALLLDYPADKLEILIGVDGDLDQTGELVASVEDDRIRLLQFPQRRGKASVLNDCVQQATGEILLFSDANTFWNADAAKHLVNHFSDSTVGGVCGRLLLVDGESGDNCDGFYWKYENQLKEWEGEIGALLGANGAIYGIRQSMYHPISSDTIVDDFVIGMRIHEQQQRLIYEPKAIAHEETAPSINHEFQRRSRIGAGAFQSLLWLWRVLLPHYGLVCWAFWSHKVLRWFCPALMLLALISNLFLLIEPLYQGMLFIQVLFYSFALVGSWTLLPGKLGRLAKVPWMFLNMNIALANGFRKWLLKTQSATWKRTQRSESEAQQPPRQTAGTPS